VFCNINDSSESHAAWSTRDKLRTSHKFAVLKSGHAGVTVVYWQDYLKRFHYIRPEKDDPLMTELRGDPQRRFEVAVRAFQRFAGLPVTGK